MEDDMARPVEDSEEIRGQYGAVDRRKLHDIIGFDVEIAPMVTNGDQWHANDPAAEALLKQIEEACVTRDEALVAYEKQKPISESASRKLMTSYHTVKTQNERALKLRALLGDLKKIPRA